MECIVGVQSGLISNHPSLTYQERVRKMARRKERACDAEFRYLLFAERPLFSVTLRDGSRTDVLKFNQLYAGGNPLSEEYLAFSDSRALLDKTYFAPIADKSWSDNTLIEFSYMDDAPAPASAPTTSVPTQEPTIDVGKSTKEQVRMIAGQAHVVPFKTGYEVWLYVFEIKNTETMKIDGYTELVILFDPSGVVKKLRQHTYPKAT